MVADYKRSINEKMMETGQMISELGQNPVDLASMPSPEQQDMLREYVSYPQQEEKVGIFHFFNKVLDTDNSSKVGNLFDTELNSVRLLQSTALYARVMGLDVVGDFLVGESEIILSTSDSRRGFLINAVITTKKELRSGGSAAGSGGEGKKSKWFDRNVGGAHV